MNEISNIMCFVILIFTLFLFIISTFAYYRNPHKRLLLVGVAFGIFFVKGILLCVGILYQFVEDLFSYGLDNFLDLLIITLLIAAIIIKK